jgi:predicted nuclease of predicted toxin-antitoxin system
VKLLLDHCVPNRIGKLLAEAGHEVILLQECLSTDSADLIVIRKADELDAILVSLNGDFADIATYPPANYRGIVACQVRNRPNSIIAITERLIAYLNQFPDQRDMKGKLLLVEAHRIRIRT